MMKELPDYEYWLKFPLWNIEDAVRLTHGVEPDPFRGKKTHKTGRKRHVLFPETLKIIRSYVDAGMFEIDNKNNVCPAKFLKLIRNLKMRLPERFEISLKKTSPIEYRNQQTEEPEKTLRNNQKDKIRCQTIAGILWEDNPGLSIASLIEHSHIRKHGNGNLYKDKTLRVWLSEIDPRSEEKKRGRPPSK
ncbi:MAG: hypothetical protein HQL52_19890 [Magnetococcales bacterium]|nr:hypothetical protein [Magnetococcales bacterium]